MGGCDSNVFCIQWFKGAQNWTRALKHVKSSWHPEITQRANNSTKTAQSSKSILMLITANVVHLDPDLHQNTHSERYKYRFGKKTLVQGWVFGQGGILYCSDYVTEAPHIGKYAIKFCCVIRADMYVHLLNLASTAQYWVMAVYVKKTRLKEFGNQLQKTTVAYQKTNEKLFFRVFKIRCPS